MGVRVGVRVRGQFSHAMGHLEAVEPTHEVDRPAASLLLGPEVGGGGE